MPRHTFKFPPSIRESVKRHVERCVQSVDADRYAQEHAYVTALASKLEGIVYEDDDGFVEFRSTIVNDRGRGSAESWSGADLAITAKISNDHATVEKAILAQAKHNLSNAQKGELQEQIRKMQGYTRSPKILEIQHNGVVNPGIHSGNLYEQGKQTKRYRLSDYIVQRVLTTLDGDTRPEFVTAVQKSNLPGLQLRAYTRWQ